ncbi:mitochondrial amino-acid acetyltransferase [Dichomitus squalens LYAD-421 SS1]|uniref:mitochondrial amino-acid acetyltransferase n=1 Tax=Dichomitus squalens (strain LYAD-421) TaxID=732165 RepID=UPI0004413175|nr:mitochondrial amino-acid acetyltransferase [Dichomitus squalens LYAD-421 SS1]EJF67069.1 mitochondrial amino-acid acetyltransferase [Dichomitus squalens LYAD-421 SS1]
MLSHSAAAARIGCRNTVNPASAHSRSAQTFKAFYATIRSLRTPYEPPEPDDVEPSEKDFILSLLRANPSLRDTRSYLASFGPRPMPAQPAAPRTAVIPVQTDEDVTQQADTKPPDIKNSPSPVVASILNPVYRRTALVKIQAPFTDRQLESIARGMVYLEKLGLVSVIVLENDQLPRGDSRERTALVEETMRVVNALEKQGARARPVLGTVVRLGPKPGEEHTSGSREFDPPEAHTFPSDLVHIRSALRAGEIPVLPPLALDSLCRSVRVDANDVIAALVRGMVEAAALDKNAAVREDSPSSSPEEMDLVPLRLMIISREGGVPSYARQGMPHLLINLTSEYDYIRNTFDPRWKLTHSTALSNLRLARTCLAYMPPTSSAVMVSHRSPSSLIGNLITNKPALSSSLPHALLQGNRKLTPDTPTILRHGLPVRVVRRVDDLDKTKLKKLLEHSFRRELEEDAFWARMERDLDFVIVAGDYAGAAIVTREPCPPGTPDTVAPITYLDKFAVLPEHQGDGTVDFLWVALHDETYGLGLPFSANPNGGKEGKGEGRDLVWRSRADNPVNKWYFERSTGHIRQGDWVLFWCDAEARLKTEEGRRASAGLSYLEDWEVGRLATWSDVVMKIPSSWKPKPAKKQLK